MNDAKSPPAPSQLDVDFWSILMSAFVAGLEDRRFSISSEDSELALRFFLERVEEKGFRLVPAKPTKAMVRASREAMKRGKRYTESRVGENGKHRWRLRAAIEKAPNWRRGMIARTKK